MKIAVLFLVLFLVACESDYPQPDIQIQLNRPFYLRNTENLPHPVNRVDQAVFSDTIANVRITVRLISLKNHACTDGAIFFKVQLWVNDKRVSLMNRDSQGNCGLYSDMAEVSGYTIRILNIENYREDVDPGLQGEFRKVKLLLTKK